jgi:hypothetical protein
MKRVIRFTLASPAHHRQGPRRRGVPVDDTIIIEPRFNGPRLSGNGGYVSGVMAGRFTEHVARDSMGGGGTVEVTLRAPVPIARPLKLVRDGEALLLRDGDTLICEARAGSVAQLMPPPPPRDWDDVMNRGEQGGSPEGSAYGTCLVCGRGRAVGDGLRVLGTPGPQPGHSLCCYLPHANHADAEGRIRPEFVWGALDCPGATAVQDVEEKRPVLTGRMTAKLFVPPHVGERCAVVGWKIGEDGRKLYSGTALYTEGGRLCALAACTWIVLKN